ncbi:NifZ [mine drainage metagenome]|uniref:NifZ n=1 Tax=mine drainage metagenome TaxID=410659 RepID=T1CAA3_9ZZZZ
MIGERIPKYQWGQPVTAITDLLNDGTFPGKEPGDLLVKTGCCGEIVQVGSHEETNTPVYLVEFAEGLVVGCLEEELVSL